MKDFPPIYQQKLMKLSRPGHGAVALLAAANQEETDRVKQCDRQQPPGNRQEQFGGGRKRRSPVANANN